MLSIIATFCSALNTAKCFAIASPNCTSVDAAYHAPISADSSAYKYAFLSNKSANLSPIHPHFAAIAFSKWCAIDPTNLIPFPRSKCHS
jgi:hypothetical protein